MAILVKRIIVYFIAFCLLSRRGISSFGRWEEGIIKRHWFNRAHESASREWLLMDCSVITSACASLLHWTLLTGLPGILLSLSPFTGIGICWYALRGLWIPRYDQIRHASVPAFLDWCYRRCTCAAAELGGPSSVIDMPRPTACCSDRSSSS